MWCRSVSACAIVAAVLVGCGSVHRTPPPTSPLLLSCRQEATEQSLWPPAKIRPGPGDLIVGPLSFPNGRRLAHMRPRVFQPTGRLTGWYKIPPVLAPGATVTVAIAPRADSYVVMITPASPPGVAAATFHGCPHAWGFFPGGFQFTDGRVRGCVPMDVTVRGEWTRRVVLSLFAGDCSS
jgi:hypothetical protein